MFRKALLIVAGAAIGVYASPQIAAYVDVDANHPATLLVGGGVMACFMLMVITARKP